MRLYIKPCTHENHRPSMDSGIRIGYNSLLVMFPAERSVALVANELHLLSLCDHLPVQYPGIEVCPLAAPAYRLDLLDVISKLHEPLCAGEKMTSEVCPQTIADDGYIMLIHQIT